MKVFISWSGERSKRVAELLSTWLKCVLQASKPWLSSDMDRGVVWFNTLSEALAETTTGIVCLTAENLNSPWILFEAGSLSHGLTDKRVCTFLIDIHPADVEPPLSQFNHTEPNRTSVYSLVKTINERLSDRRLDIETLNIVFDTYFSQFEYEFNKIISETSLKNEDNMNKNDNVRTEQDLLEEVLLTVRNVSKRLQRVERDAFSKKSWPRSSNIVLKDDVLSSLLSENIIIIEKILQGEDEDDNAFNALVKSIEYSRKMPPTMAKDVAYQCLKAISNDSNMNWRINTRNDNGE